MKSGEALHRHGVMEIRRVTTYMGRIEGIEGAVVFRFGDGGADQRPRWSVQAFGDADELLGSDAEDNLGLALMGVFNKPRLRNLYR